MVTAILYMYKYILIFTREKKFFTTQTGEIILAVLSGLGEEKPR